ncbi:MAG: alpha-glucosidase [Lentisphaerae bacterium ADurb.BinA184]|nr:MAG: alpha-glucosidase [Lentisphaerae bacterium ADurb.BinA184]
MRDPMPAVRGLGIDARVEPACEVARTLCLTLDGHGGRVSFDMPAFESLGRLAPKREFAATAWPTADQLRAAVPEPVLPENIAHFAKLYYATWDMLLGLTRTPDATSGLPGSYVATGAGFVYHQFVWDSSFTAISTGYGHRVFDPFASLNLLYSRQFDGGYIHREHDVRDGLPALYEPDFSPNPPIMTIAEWAVARLTGNRERLRQVFPVLEGNHAWLRHNRRLPDGTYWTTGLANGLDNFPSLGDGYPCLTAQMAHEAETLARIAQALEMPEKADEYRAEHEAVARAANRFLWSREQGLYATSLPGGGHNPNKVVTTFWPLWAGIVPPERVEALAQHLKDPKSFWRHHPIPSLAADSPHFSPEGSYWRGSTWAPTNFAAIKGFDRAGQHALAVETATRHIQCMLEVFEETGKIWENYCSEASRRGNWSGPNYCWSSLGPVALLLEVILGFEPDALNRRLLWNPPSRQTAGVRRLPLGPATVSVVQQKDWQGKWGIEIDTDRPFTLALHEGECTREIACPVGRSRVTPA